MSKMDNLRAMREARYEAAQARSKGTPAARPVPPLPVAPLRIVTEADLQPEPPGEQLCGHRNMSGRTCTREHGHAAKSHRYS